MPAVDLVSEPHCDILLNLPESSYRATGSGSPSSCDRHRSDFNWNDNVSHLTVSSTQNGSGLSAKGESAAKNIVFANESPLSHTVAKNNNGDWSSLKRNFNNNQGTLDYAHEIASEMIDMSICVPQADEEEFDHEFDTNLLFDSMPLDGQYVTDIQHRIAINIPQNGHLDQERLLKDQSIISDAKQGFEVNKKRSPFAITDQDIQIMPQLETKMEHEFSPTSGIRRANKRRDTESGRYQNGKAKCARLPRRSRSDFGAQPISKRTSSISSFSRARKSKTSSNDDFDGDSSDIANDEKGTLSKTKKNERERKRRLAVSQGFDELSQLLLPKDAEDEGKSAAKVDKATILRKTIDTIRSLERRLEALTRENEKLRHGLST